MEERREEPSERARGRVIRGGRFDVYQAPVI
jgi:hypothetical protein